MTEATERILGLAAYLEKRGRDGATLGDLTDDVPGYETVGELTPKTREWETVRRRIRRDLDDLDTSFAILIECDDDDRYRLRSPFFTRAERLDLLAAAAAVELEGLDDEPALGELGAAVADDGRRIVLSVPDRVRQLSDAIRDRRPVQFRYHGRDRTVDAYALGRWRTHWYVVGREHECDDRRKFRLDRIEVADGDGAAVRALDAPGSYALPPAFDAVDEMDLDPNDWGHDPLLVARVRVDADHVHNFQYELGGRVVERDEASRVVELDVRHYGSFRTRLLGFREHAVVIAPPALVTIVRDHLTAVVGGA